MDSPQPARLHAIVHGRVQGVGFRFFTMQSAWTLEVTGWVRNRFDGTVEVTAEGNRPKLDSLLDEIKRGPASAFVASVDAEWLPFTGEFTSFDPRETI